MTYEETMKWKSHRYDFQTNQYIAEDHSYLDMPLSKCPIAIKIIRAIQERKSFNNLGSSVATAVRWVGDFYVVSVREYTQAGKWEDIDIAAGRQGEVPFAFRAPYTFDPESPTRIAPVYEKDPITNKYATVYRDIYDTPKGMYANAYSVSFQTRLSTLQVHVYRKKAAVGTKINPATGRKNKIYASVAHYNVYHDNGDVFPIWMNLSDRLEQISKQNSDKEISFAPLKRIPLIKFGWYTRTGEPCQDPTAPIINPNPNTNTKANA
jgi:hypothetical protein